MIRFLFVMIIVAVAMSLLSCSHDNEYPDLNPPEPPEMLTPEVGLSISDVRFGCSGGVEKIRIVTNVPLALEPDSGFNANDILCGKPAFFEDREPLCISTSLMGDSVLVITGEANQSCFDRSHIVNLYYGNDAVSSVRITFEGDSTYEPRLSVSAHQGLNDILESLVESVQMTDALQLSYGGVDVCGCRYSDANVARLWDTDFRTLHYVNAMRLALRNDGYCSEENILSIYSAIVYVSMIDEWGNLPLLTPDNIDETDAPRTVVPYIQSYFANLMHSAIEVCREGVTGGVRDASHAYMLSKDVARMALADIYMQLRKYHFAAELLDEIIRSHRYSLADDGRSNLILGIYEDNSSEPYPLYTLTDVYLKYAECQLCLENGVAASEYIDAVLCAHPELSFGEFGNDGIECLDYIRRKLFLPGYLSFCKRHSLLNANALWPIPSGAIPAS